MELRQTAAGHGRQCTWPHARLAATRMHAGLATKILVLLSPPVARQWRQSPPAHGLEGRLPLGVSPLVYHCATEVSAHTNLHGQSEMTWADPGPLCSS